MCFHSGAFLDVCRQFRSLSGAQQPTPCAHSCQCFDLGKTGTSHSDRLLKKWNVGCMFHFSHYFPNEKLGVGIFSHVCCGVLGRCGVGIYNAMNFLRGFLMQSFCFGLTWVGKPHIVSGVFTKAIC